MPSELPSDKAAEIARRVALRQPYSQIAREMRLSISTVSKYATAKADDPEPKAEGPRSFSENGDDAKLEYPLRARVVTLDDAIAHGQVDTSVWYVDRWECTSWEMGFVRKDGEADSLPLWRVKLYLKRIAPKAILDAAEAIYERLATIGPRTFDEPVAVILGRPAMMSLDLFDVHFGKLAWKPESGEDYDLKIAERRFRTATARLLDHAASYSLDQVVIAVGNDLIHIDSLSNTTTGGTPMDTDGRLAKIISTVSLSLIDTVEYTLRRAHKVKLIYVPGNHDYLTSYFMCRELAAYFRNNDRVEVDCGPASWKTEHWGKNLIGYTHGKDAKDPKSLALALINSNRQAYAESVCSEVHQGHYHTHKSIEVMGIVVRWLSALSGVDKYHFDRLFTGNRKAAEAYLYSRDEGLIGNFIAGGE